MASWDIVILTGIALIMLAFFTYMFWRETAVRSREKPAEIYTVVR